MEKKTSFLVKRSRRKKTIFAIVAVLLSIGLLGSTMVGILDFSSVTRSAGPYSRAEAVSADLEEEVKANPGDINILKDLARAYERENKQDKAVETYEKAVSLEPDRDDLKNRLAGSYVIIGQTDKAIQILEEVIGKTPGNKEAHYYLGLALLSKKEYGGAVENFERVIELGGENDPDAARAKRLLETWKPLVGK